MSVTYKLGILTRSTIARPEDGIWGYFSKQPLVCVF